jgi:hypothetical protein
VIEFVGWYYDLWAFAPYEDNPFSVILMGVYIGLTFYANELIIGFLYAISLRNRTKNRKYYLCLILISMTIVGWGVDIFIGEFTSYILTFFVWLSLQSLHLILFLFIHKKIMNKENQFVRFIV